jgi:hypothetical protein
LLVHGVVLVLYPVDHQNGDNAPSLPGCGRDAVAEATICRREDLGRDQEREAVCAYGPPYNISLTRK